MTKEKVTRLEENVREQKYQIERYNTALKVLMEYKNNEIKNTYKMISSEIKKIVFPFLEKIAKESPNSNSQTYIKIIKDNLNRIAFSNTDNKPLFIHSLTPTEAYIVELIKQGRRSKEIANSMNVSLSTISFHRNNIRNKLGLKNTKKNLFAYLNSLST